MSTPFWPADLEALNTLAERVSDAVVDHGARLVVEVWGKSDQGPVAWIEMHPSDSDPNIRFTRMRGAEMDGNPVISASFSDPAGNPIPATITVTRSGAEDEPAEAAPVEVTEEPSDLSLAVSDCHEAWRQANPKRAAEISRLATRPAGVKTHD